MLSPPLPEGGGQRPGFELKSFFLVKCPAPGTLQLVKTELPPPPNLRLYVKRVSTKRNTTTTLEGYICLLSLLQNYINRLTKRQKMEI